MGQALLNEESLPGIPPARAWLPAYRRTEHEPGVVHLGLGAFHRAHQALVFDELLAQGDARWGILGVAMRSPEVAQTLRAQDGLYSVQIASAGGKSWRVVGSVWQTCVAAREPEQVVDAIGAASTRWLTLTVTEKGYTPELAALIVRGLAARQSAGLPGLTVASCDNLSGNGDLLKTLCLQAAADSGLRDWIAGRCAFPNSMVDRIVPAATGERREQAAMALGVQDAAALATEEFWEWVIEDRLADPADAGVLRSVGVTVVPDVRPFEEAKLRMLNGSHSALACIGAVAGLPTVADCIARPEIRAFVHGLMTQEVMPLLSRPGLPAYRDALLERFANPELRHSVHQIATDSSRKIPQRWLPCVLAQLAADGPLDHLAFAAAAWMRYCRGEDEAGQSYVISDPLAVELQTLARTDGGAVARGLLEVEAVWGGELPHHPRWMARVAHWSGQIAALGVLQTLRQFRR